MPDLFSLKPEPSAAFTAALLRAAECLNLSLSTDQVDVLARHFAAILETNSKFNLTRVTDPAAAAAKLYADSLAPLAYLRQASAQARRILDVGTGAGFPAVPIAVAQPTAKVTAIDSTAKKARFVEECAQRLGLTNLTCLHARAGEWKAPQPFDMAVFKAIGPLAGCVSTAHRLVRREGLIIVFKSSQITREEIDAGQEQAESMGATLWDTFDYDLPCGDETLESTLFVFKRM